MEKEEKTKFIEKLKNQIKELTKTERMSYEDIEEKPITTLDKKLLKKYQEIFEEIMQICEKEKIDEISKFDENYPVFQWGLQNFLDNYANHMDYCSQISEEFLNQEIKMTKSIINQFNLDDQTKREYEIIIIRDTYKNGDKKGGQEQLEKWIKANPTEGGGYELKCDWELEKENPDMEKVASVLEEADNNGTFIADEEIYDKVIEYFEDIGNEEMAQYYESLLDFKEDDDYYDIDGYDIDEDDYEEIDEQYEGLLEEEKRELINEIKNMATDKVNENKTFEQYISEKENNSLMTFLALTVIMSPEIALKEINKSAKKYIIENYENVLKEDMKYMPDEIISKINDFPEDGFLKIDMDKSKIEDLSEVTKYFLLKQLGIAFIGKKDNNIIIVIPYIKKIKEYIKNKEVKEKNKEINEKIKVIRGICELHGAMKVKKIYHIFEEFYGENDKEKLARYLIIICGILGAAMLKIDEKTGSLQFIYNNMIDEKMAKQIIKANKDVRIYSKEEYIKHCSLQFIKETKGYKMLEEELNSGIFYGEGLFKMLSEILIPYIMERRLGSDLADNMKNELVEQLEMLEKNGFECINTRKVKEAFKVLDAELSRWK